MLIPHIADKEFLKEVYKKWEDKAEYGGDTLYLADSICEQLDDKEWGKKLYKKVENIFHFLLKL